MSKRKLTFRKQVEVEVEVDAEEQGHSILETTPQRSFSKAISNSKSLCPLPRPQNAGVQQLQVVKAPLGYALDRN